MQISWQDFEKLDIRSGTIIAVDDFPSARKPAYRLKINFGEEIGELNSSAQVTVHYKKEDLLNRQIIAVINFPPKNIAGFISQCLVLGIYDHNHDVILVHPGLKAPDGARLG